MGGEPELVAVDIGGTHARFAIAKAGPDGTIVLSEVVTLNSSDYPNLEAAWGDFRERNGDAVPPSASIAVAGPTGGEFIRFTNNPWTIQPGTLAKALGVDRLCILNDFEAVAHAVARTSDDHYVHLAGPDCPLPVSGTISVLGPGTGLGVAHYWRDGMGQYRVQATEGGHVAFAPADPVEDALLARLRDLHGRVSVERVVAGPAISDMYRTLAEIDDVVVPADLGDVAIWSRGIDGSDELAAAALSRFCMALGSVAGDMALAHGANGVVIAGGLGLRLRDKLPLSGFARRFCAKGRFSEMMAAMPVKLIVHPQPGLYGAAAAFLSEFA